MMTQTSEKTIARLLAIGSALIAITVITGTVTDPVNVTKLLVLGGVACGAFATTMAFGLYQIWSEAKSLFVFVTLFLVASFNAIVNSQAPLVQSIYGVYGRNTAFLTYLFLIFLLLAAVALRSESSFRALIWGLFVAGVVNVLYCTWAILFGDFVGWSNPYGNILGTFGNPNFIGAFLGIFAAALVGYNLKSGLSTWFRMGSALIFLLALYAIIDSSAIQGRVVVVAGLGIVCFYFIRSKFNKIYPMLAYLLLATVGGAFALFGALQIGPLSKYIYKTSVSLRGEYWQAGWNMAADHPFTGVGFDNYGDWYRRARDTQALVLPGPNVTTNAAHNVPFDVLAFGGWPLFLSYLGIIVLSVIAIIKVTTRQKKYEPSFVTLTTAWLCYQLQSIISINQIGLAIWGWLLGGALIAYEISTRTKKPLEDDSSNKGKVIKTVKNTKGEVIFSSTLIAGVGIVVGLLVAAPPYSADAKWRSALASQDTNQVEQALTPGYLNPANSFKYGNAVQVLENSQLYDLAYKYAKIAVEFNPDNFDSWKVLYLVTNSSAEEKAKALAEMKRLDPNNPNVLG